VDSNWRNYLAKGDHIFVHCTGYSHHGIDCGDGRVIHFDFTPKQKLRAMFGRRESSKICVTTMDEFSSGRDVFVRRYEIEIDRDEIVRRAECRLGESGYHLFGNNCEHFAQWCVTGKAESTQVRSAGNALRPLVKGAAASILLRGLPCLSPQMRVVACGTTLGVSVAGAVMKYAGNRYRDIRAGVS
jgi:hypothetical protein